MLKKFPQVTKFSSSGYSKLQPQHGVEHVIETGDLRPARSRVWLLFAKKHTAAEREFRAMERAGIISRSSGSPWAGPLHMVKKPDLNEWRPCVDYRNLKLRTITDSYVIPNLHSLNFQLKGKQVFS